MTRHLHRFEAAPQASHFGRRVDFVEWPSSWHQLLASHGEPVALPEILSHSVHEGCSGGIGTCAKLHVASYFDSSPTPTINKLIASIDTLGIRYSCSPFHISTCKTHRRRLKWGDVMVMVQTPLLIQSRQQSTYTESPVHRKSFLHPSFSGNVCIPHAMSTAITTIATKPRVTA